jgi:uncharacterized protein (TIGR03085 family)
MRGSGTTQLSAGGFVARERRELADALLVAGPGAATLCGGWTAHDLAAHVVARERSPLSSVGLVVSWLSGRAERARSRCAGRPFEELVEQVAAGPGRLSPMRVPAVGPWMNVAEFFVHTEDVRRTSPGWEPRPRSEQEQELLWRLLQRSGRMLYRHSPVPVRLLLPDGRSTVAVAGGMRTSGAVGPPPNVLAGVVLSGEPAELVLHGFGRGAHAKVRAEGHPQALHLFSGISLDR